MKFLFSLGGISQGRKGQRTEQTCKLTPALTLPQCAHDRLEVRCADTSEDLCPYGHIHYGLLTLVILAAPGALYGYSEFMHFKAFR